jgi:GNAT superfamily N-acetyltransferase
VLIRQATTSDIGDVARVHVAAWDAAKEGLDLTTRRTLEDREDLWARFLDAGRGALWLAEAEGGVVGFCAIGPSRDEDRAGESEIYTLYVDPHRWGRGIGSALMSQARSFYAHHGFSPDGAREEGHHVPVIRVVRTASGESPAAGGPLFE